MSNLNCYAVWKNTIFLSSPMWQEADLSVWIYFPLGPYFSPHFLSHFLPCYRWSFSPSGNHNSITVKIEMFSGFLLVLEYLLRTNCQFPLLWKILKYFFNRVTLLPSHLLFFLIYWLELEKWNWRAYQPGGNSHIESIKKFALEVVEAESLGIFTSDHPWGDSTKDMRVIVSLLSRHTHRAWGTITAR